ncbi:unnamed protein product [Amoebophrya sp. A25]|nr:unnamed protein product [Amoebophrya sp. A25]|eukprot:GSA25T00007780001.1
MLRKFLLCFGMALAQVSQNIGLEQQMGMLFQQIMVSMGKFDGVKPALIRVQQRVYSEPQVAAGLDARSRALLDGAETEKMHLEFLRLQKVAQDYTQSPTLMTEAGRGEQYLRDLDTYARSLAQHVDEVAQSVAKLDKNAPSGNMASTPGIPSSGASGPGHVGVGIPIKLPGQLGGANAGASNGQGPSASVTGGALRAGSGPGPLPPAASTPPPISAGGGVGNNMLGRTTAAPFPAAEGVDSGSLFPRGGARLAEKPDMNMWKAQQMMGNLPAGDAPAPAGVAGPMGAGPNGGKASKLDFLFLDLQNGMSDFEQLKPLFAQVQSKLTSSSVASKLSVDDKRVLQGIVAEELNMRFLSIQQTADRVERERQGRFAPAEEKQFADEVEKFIQDMRAHSARVRELFSGDVLRMRGQVPAPLPRADPNAQVDPNSIEMRRIAVHFSEIQSNMQIFERELAPRFASVTQSILQKAPEARDRDILTGEASQKLHLRFVTLQARLHSSYKEKAYEQEVAQFAADLSRHVQEALKLMKQLGVEKSAMPAIGGGAAPVGGAPIGGTPIGGAPIGGGGAAGVGGPQLSSQQLGGGLRSVPQNNMPTPSNFAGGGGRPMDPTSKKINDLFEKIEKHMNYFETKVKPLFRNVPAPQVLMSKFTDKAELKIATGQASEDIHRRFLSIQQRTQSLERQAGPAIQAFIIDLQKFEQDLAVHVPQAEEVMKRASQMSQGSTEAYKKQTPTLSEEEMEAELKKVEQDINEADRRLPTTLRNLKKRMKDQIGQLSDQSVVNKEVNKMTHMLAAIKSAALQLLKQIRNGFGGKGDMKAMSELFWGDFATESQRFLATIRDLQKEEMQTAREENKGGDMAQNINMPGMKLTGSILGTSGVTQQSLEQNKASEKSYVSRGMVNGGAAAGMNNDAENAMLSGAAGAAMQPGSGGAGLGGVGGLTGLAKLPKLEL